MQQDRKHIHGEPGILRKKHENEEELLVFGYSCKLFRDDEKALYIDQGKHLIPWMGDELLKIDRYDVRGALSDLSQYESKSGIHGSSDWSSMSSEERRIEQLCDEERYRALYHNEEEEALYQEEELKRLHQALGSDKEYGQVEYKYGDDNVHEETIEKEAVDEHDEPFIPPPNLDIPPNMVTPETKKLNAIIEKTAMFINQQGPQMEILLKMKQASNRQFDFLSFSSPLHPYYRHLLMVIKSGRYRPVSLIEETSIQDEQKAYEDHYLHPSLAPAPTVLEAAPSIPSINYKPSSDCLYSMLVNKIKGKLEDKGGTLENTKEATTDKEPAESSTSYEEVPKPSVEICAGPVRYTYNSTSQNSSSEELSARSSPVQLLSKAAKRRRRKRLHSEVAANGDSSSHDLETSSVETTTNRVDSNNEYSENTPTYQNNSYSSSTDTLSYIEEPPSELKVIIDKMAVYVAKNGTSFESIVRNKGGGDPRFAFLDVNNEYHAYYRQKVEVYERVQKPPPPPPVPAVTVQSEEVGTTQYGGDMETETTDSDKNLSQFSETSHNYSLNVDSPQSSDKSSLPSPSDTSSSQSKPVPVCFSIKKPKETEKLELCSALPVEESSEDEEGEEDIKSQDSSEKHEALNSKKGEDKKSKEISVKKWEERVKDKLALAAKEKLSVKEREKQLQSERKKKAAAFLHQLQKETSGTASATGSQSDDLSVSGIPTAESVPSCVTSPASESSSEKEERNNNVRISTPRIPSPIQISDEEDKGRGESSHAAETLARILEAIPKEKRNHVSKHSHHHSSSRRSRSHSYTKYDNEQRHRHHRHHRHHHNERERSETHHRSSHKRKHKHKSSGKSYKRKRRNNSSSSE